MTTVACLGIGTFVLHTATAASKGATSPVAAADAVIEFAFGMDGDGDMSSVTRYLEDSAANGLKHELQQYAAKLRAKGMWLSVEPDITQQRSGSDVIVTLSIRSEWSVQSADGQLWYNGSAHPWMITTRESHGLVSSEWKVTKINAPEPCGTYIRC